MFFYLLSKNMYESACILVYRQVQKSAKRLDKRKEAYQLSQPFEQPNMYFYRLERLSHT